jgi:phosphatidate cytidylyltransferase|tara:strand:+ start:1715 stop:2281 length:567 start_codon:yes stop_codon:yes gene_type:complete
MISIVCLMAFFEWKKNKFRHPMLWGFSLIFIYFWATINFVVASYSILEINSSSNITIFYLFFIFIINTAIFDSFAYFIGSNFGKNSIAPKISPNKTIEGLIGGFIGVTIYGFIICSSFGLGFWIITIYIYGGLLAFLGDLLISFHKRDKGIKDTGSLLPGHGGILDRIDSHLLALPQMLFLSFLIDIT